MTRPSPSLQQLNRTFIGSVLFIDIVGYSRRTVPDQLSMKEIFNRLLMDAVQTVAPAERIMVDTGDGAGVAFLGDPEDALFTALSLRDAICASKTELGEPGFVRMGINLGPLKMVRDINGHTNMIGDGVNDAQRVMSFAEPGQVMVSHAYLDIISRFSRDYTKLFVYEGTRQDKHVREHEVYRFGPAEGAEKLTEQLNEKMRDRTRAHLQDDADGLPVQPSFSQVGASNAAWPSHEYATSAGRNAGRSSIAAAAGKYKNPKATAALAAAAFGALAVTGAVWSWMAPNKESPAPILAAASTPSVNEAASSSSSSAASGAAANSPASANAAHVSFSPSAANAAAGKNAEKSAAQAAGKSGKQEEEKSEKKNGDEEHAAKPGTIKLSVQPWGEILVDGSKRGVSPPLKSFSLPPGKHRIEIRNSQFAPYKQTVEVKSNAETTVHYAF